MKNYFDILGKQIAENRAVAYRESVMEEISSVARLIDEMLQNYIEEEIVRIGELNRQIQSTTFVMVIISFALLAMTGWYARKSYQHVQQAIDEPVQALDKMGKGTDARIDLELALFSLCEPENVSAAAPAPQPWTSTSPRKRASCRPRSRPASVR